MLIQYILNHLKKSTIEESVQRSVVDLLSQIKESDALLSEFNSMDSHTLTSQLTVDHEEVDPSNSNLPPSNPDTPTVFFQDMILEYDLPMMVSGQDNTDPRTTDANRPPHFSIPQDTMPFEQGSSPDTPTLSMEELMLNPILEGSSQIGRYVDLGVLGEGGMGEVRKVRDEILNRNLAMKIVHPSMLLNGKALTRFFEEAQIGAQLQHPNIIPIHEFGELPDGRLYFTMKEIKGTEFSKCIREVHEVSTEDTWLEGNSGYTFRQLIQTFHKVCETIAYAHSVDVIHRDLKPENIMLGDFGEVLVVDWGIAKVLNTDASEVEDNEVQVHRSKDSPLETRMGMIAGTPTYMSPEQAEGRVDLMGPATDIYSLGAILYQILSGRMPYTGTSAQEIIQKVLVSRPPSLNTTGSRKPSLERPNIDLLIEDTGKIPLPLIEMCERAMERDIADRYRTAADFAEDIFNWLEGAQKRDKALDEYSVALSLYEEAMNLKATSVDIWNKANATIEANDAISDDLWMLWEQSNEMQQQVKVLLRDYRSTLQGALVYDPELMEANQALATILVNDIVRAAAHGAMKERTSTEKLLEKYVQHLPKRRQQFLMDTLRQQCNDEIVLMKVRQGDFIGRQQTRASIVETLEKDDRLISLVGTAGVGKSRLALEVISDLQTSTVMTYFCNLTEATSEMGIARSIAKVIGVQLNDSDPVAQLGTLFTIQPTILVLDNLEQVLEPIQRVITQWMSQSDTLRIIVTSRIQLRMKSEVCFQIQPLTRLESIELFVKRGQLSKPSFNVHAGNYTVLERVVQRLDHLPLAIELAAARLNLFTVDEIEQRLEERFSLLRSRNDQTPALQGALDWSWDLLKPWAKTIFAQTSVFRGGFDLQAAEAVLTYGEWKDAPPVFDILQDLCDDSLLQQHRLKNGSIRYKLLESVRQYAAAQLHNTIASMQTRRRHIEHYAQFGETTFLDRLDDLPQNDWGQFSEELDNFIIAIEYATDSIASKCCFAAVKILRMKGPASLGVEITNRVLQMDHISNRDRKTLWIARSHFLRISGRIQEARQHSLDDLLSSTSDRLDPNMPTSTNDSTQNTSIQQEDETTQLLEADVYFEQGNIEENESLFPKALSKYEQARAIYEQLEHPKRIATVLLKIGGVHRSMGDYDQALHAFESTLEIATHHDIPLLRADTLTEIGKIHVRNGEYRSAVEQFEPSLEIALTFDDLFRQERNLGSMGVALASLGEYDRAIELDLKAIAINRKVGNRRNESTMVGNVGNLYSALGQYDKALSNIELALQISREIGNKYLESMHLGNLAIIFDSRGDFPAAIEKYKESLAVCEEIGDMPQKGLTLGNLGEAHIRIQEWDEAVQYLSMSIDICNSTLPTASGAFSGSLAWVCAKQGSLAKALNHIQYGEPLVAVYPFEHAKFLCRKAQILHWSNQPNRAREALEQAEAIKEGLHTENAELTQLIAESVQALSTQQ